MVGMTRRAKVSSYCYVALNSERVIFDGEQHSAVLLHKHRMVSQAFKLSTQKLLGSRAMCAAITSSILDLKLLSCHMLCGFATDDAILLAQLHYTMLWKALLTAICTHLQGQSVHFQRVGQDCIFDPDPQKKYTAKKAQATADPTTAVAATTSAVATSSVEVAYDADGWPKCPYTQQIQGVLPAIITDDIITTHLKSS